MSTTEPEPVVASAHVVGPYNDGKTLVASARLLSTTREDAPKLDQRTELAWSYYETCPELSFGVNWKAKGVSKGRLIAAHRPAPGEEPEPIYEGPAAEAVDALCGGNQGQAAMLEAFSVHLDVPGAGYLVMNTDIPEIENSVLSAEEIRLQGGSYIVQVSEGSNGWEPIPNALVVKVWRPSKRKRLVPFSPTMPLLSTLQELQHINEHIDATLVSRLAGAGILLTPSEQVFPSQDENVSAEDAFQIKLQTALTTPIKNRGSAGAVVPLHVQVPGDLIEKWRHLTFWSEVNEQVLAMRESAVRRVAVGLDVPAEVILGMGDMSHWAAWQIEESTIKMTIEPALEQICNDLTFGYLDPVRIASMGNGETGWEGDEIIWFDLSELVARPDRGPQAGAARDRMDISTPAYLRETGLNDTDAPTTEQLREMAWKSLIRDPTYAPAAMVALGLATPEEFQVGAPAPMPGAEGVPPDATGLLDQADTPGTPGTLQVEKPPAQQEVPSAPNSGMVAASYGIVHRALERAGGRLRNKQKTACQGITASAEFLHTQLTTEQLGDIELLLEGAWSQVPVIAAACGTDPEELTRRLGDYTRYLLVTHKELTLRGIADWLEAPDPALAMA